MPKKWEKKQPILLIDRLELDIDNELEEEHYQTIVIETELIERKSTK